MSFTWRRLRSLGPVDANRPVDQFGQAVLRGIEPCRVEQGDFVKVRLSVAQEPGEP